MSPTELDLPYPPETRVGRQSRGGLSGFPWTISLLTLAFSALVLAGPTWISVKFTSVHLSSFCSVALLCSAWVCSICWHEAGHFIAAIVNKFEVTGIALGPMRVSRAGRRWSFRFQRSNVLAASISAFPRQGAAWRLRMLGVIAAGPIATLIAATFSAAIVFGTSIQGAWVNWLIYFSEINTLLFVLGLVPNSNYAPVRNDAALFVSLWMNAAAAEEILRYHLLLQLRRDGCRPRSYPRHLIQELARPCERADFSIVFANAICEFALDLGIGVLLDHWDRYALAQGAVYGSPWSDFALAHSSCFDLAYRQKIELAAPKVAHISTYALNPPWFRFRTSAIRELISGESERANGDLRRACHSLDSQIPYHAFQLELLAVLREYCARTSRNNFFRLKVT